MQQPAEEAQLVIAAKLGPVTRRHRFTGVGGDDLDAPLLERAQLAVRADADGGVQRLRPLVIEV
jgi:hypothetical protein